MWGLLKEDGLWWCSSPNVKGVVGPFSTRSEALDWHRADDKRTRDQ